MNEPISHEEDIREDAHRRAGDVGSAAYRANCRSGALRVALAQALQRIDVLEVRLRALEQASTGGARPTIEGASWSFGIVK